MSVPDWEGWGAAIWRPIDTWPGPLTGDLFRKPSPFSASWTSTTELLHRELVKLNARRVLFQAALTEAQIRKDGRGPYADARFEHPGVILTFESNRAGGTVNFAVDTFTHWQDNARAIGLGMEALRKVDRYGITKTGEQYRGWRALPASSEVDTMDVAAARAFLEAHGGTFREAAKRLHPDTPGGSVEAFQRLNLARETLRANGSAVSDESLDDLAVGA